MTTEAQIPSPLAGERAHPANPSPLLGERARERGRQERLAFRRGLRNNATDSERRLWSRLRGDQLGARFRRQYQIGPYVVDFYCPSAKLAVEVDGGQHYEGRGMVTDMVRDQFLEGMGIEVLRFSNLDVLEQIDSVVQAIILALDPLPSPLPEGEGMKGRPLPEGEGMKRRPEPKVHPSDVKNSASPRGRGNEEAPSPPGRGLVTTEAGGYVGRPLTRREDERLLTGAGLFVADVRLAGEAHLAVLRSPHAHAAIKRVDLSAARRCGGVLAVLSFADLGPDVQRLPMLVPHKNLHPRMPYPLADRKVCYVGEPVAVVAAETRYQAEDALEAIEVEYDVLPAVTNCEAALEPGAPILHEGAESNLCASVTQSVGDIEQALRDADIVVRQTFEFGRLSGQPMEPRGVVARWERSKLGDTLTVWDATQSPHLVCRILADMLHLPQQAIRVIAADVGGGFGIKNRFYSEEFLAPFIALLLGRPVRWVEDRREDLLTTYQARQQVHHLEVAARRDGRILGMRNRFTADVGAYSPFGLVVPFNSSTTLPGPYKLPAYHVEMRAAYTTKPAMAPYRAAGRPPPVFDMERAIDLVARRLELDPAEIRARNFIQPDEFPYRTGLIERDGGDIVYDSGNYPECLRKALELLDVDAFRREQAAARRQGRHLGLGVGCYVESTGRGPFEGATVRVDSRGKVVVATGASPQGQSHETTLAQICADRLGVSFDDISVVTGDTDAINLGIGTYASRTAVVAGNAVSGAALAVRHKALVAAGQLLEASPDDLDIQAGEIRVRGVPDRSISLARVAQVLTSPPPAFTFPPGLEPGLEATNYFHPSASTYSNGTHVAIVEVDAETGQVDVLRYAIAHDCGTVINPVVVDGQCVGGLAQGLGNALYEEMLYDDAGQPLTTSYMDYLVPTAMEVPDVALAHVETPSPLNPEGIKGAGEGGTMPVPAAIANAIDDALAPLGVVVDRVPLNPERLWQLIGGSR